MKTKKTNSKLFKLSMFKNVLRVREKNGIEQEKQCLYRKRRHGVLIAKPTHLNIVKEIESKHRRLSGSINKKRIRTEMQGK